MSLPLSSFPAPQLEVEVQFERKSKANMIDLMENKILGPAIRQGFKQGWEEGFLIGIQEGREMALLELLIEDLLEERYGKIPPWAQSRIAAATHETLKLWHRRLVGPESLEDFLAEVAP